MAQTMRWLSASNGFLPQATGQVIAYVRNPSRFKMNQYCQLVRSPKPVGFYFELDHDHPVRVVTDQESAWPDGTPRPMHNNELGEFRAIDFICDRRDYGFRIGQQAMEAADWQVRPFHMAAALSQAMTNKTQRIITLLETSGNWPTTNTADANTLNGAAGKWNTASDDPQSPYYLAIELSLLQAIQTIHLQTNGMVQIEDLQMVVSPGLARKMAASPEIHDYMRGSRFSLGMLTKDGTVVNVNDNWGLPPTYAGVKIVVEDAVRTTSRQNATSASSGFEGTRIFIKQDTSAVITSRVGGLDGEYGAPSFSTTQVYYYLYELAVESFADAKNKLEEGHVVDQFKEVLAAGHSGYLITNTL